MHYPASELLRIPLPRTRVNKGKRKAGSVGALQLPVLAQLLGKHVGELISDAHERSTIVVNEEVEGDDTHDAPDDLAHCSPLFATRL